MSYFDKIREILLSYSNLGIEYLQSGTVLIGKAPHIGRSAWLHKIYKPLTTSDIEAIEKETKLIIPSDYKLFLTNYSNGLKIFIDDLSLDGVRQIQGRTLESAWQPYSIITPNKQERPWNAVNGEFFIGGYSEDGSVLYMTNNSPTVFRSLKNDVAPLEQWDSFGDFILKETNRIAGKYDKDGVELR